MASQVLASETPICLHVRDPPYENYFYADSVVSCQTVLASPLPRPKDSSAELHRLLFAWPAGNSGAALFFKAAEDGDSPLKIDFKNEVGGRALNSIQYGPNENSKSGKPSVGVKGLLEFSTVATLSLAILGSIRTIRDYTEAHETLNPRVQNEIRINKLEGSEKGIVISRNWFDGKTTTQVKFTAVDSPAEKPHGITLTEVNSKVMIIFTSGLYSVEACLDYPQTPYMAPTQILKPAFHHLIAEQSSEVKSLSFLTSADKLLAGAWRFLTYFGRDSMITLLLLMPILSEGEQGSIELGLSAVLERINCEDGSVCHEENLGDYPAAQAALDGSNDSSAEYDYKMIDTDFFLPILISEYFRSGQVGSTRLKPFLRNPAKLIPSNAGMTYGQLLSRTCEKILGMAGPLVQSNGQTKYKNLIALKARHPVGQWRDSDDGLGGGRYPYDVNTALMPAALRAIANLARSGALEGNDDWSGMADEFAVIWETETLGMFITVIPRAEAQRRLETYREKSAFPGPSGADTIDGDVHLEAVALGEDGTQVEIMHTDSGFRLLLLPHLIASPNLACVTQHFHSLDALTRIILLAFPAGLYTPVGVLVANPAYSLETSHARKFTTGAYHGTVVWTWNSLAMLTKGLEVQLRAFDAAEKRARGEYPHNVIAANDREFYTKVRAQMKRAYAKLWDTIEANREYLSSEVWSWRWDNDARADDGVAKGNFVHTPLSHLPTPDGAGQTESNAVQLWSLTFLAIERCRELEG